MIPHTVPKSPMNGVTMPVVARIPRWRSSPSASAAAVSSSLRRTRSRIFSRASSGIDGLPRSLPMPSLTALVSSRKPATKTAARGLAR